MTTFGIPFDPARLSAGASRDDLPIDLELRDPQGTSEGTPNGHATNRYSDSPAVTIFVTVRGYFGKLPEMVDSCKPHKQSYLSF